ncbi:uncharacterized protein LOC109713637 [Ananas comosus]|uniref:Uncharacterized protein LOC109713637 n=1 Tax=Ananas comosus TaxID=4615 RepID=A0A6P5FAY3_ANACO|nr:uncharacterized protein LOC109713637 [Ananas comosus]
MENVLLSQLSLHQQPCKIKVRICRIWESTTPYSKGDIFSLDCLLVDKEEFSMQATIRKQDAEDLKCRITEGKVYVIEKFSVIPTRKKFVAVDRYYMIQLSKSTQFTEVEDDSEGIPLHSFNFSTFYEINKKQHNDSILTDVVGKIAAIGEITHRYISQSLPPIRNLEIEDFERTTMPATLWDRFATDFDEANIYEEEKSTPIIIILAGMTVRTESTFIDMLSIEDIF